MLAQGSPIFNSSCEGELGIAHESLYGKRDLILACVFRSQYVRTDLTLNLRCMYIFLKLDNPLKGSEVIQSCLTLCNHMDCSPPGSSDPWDFPGKSTGVGCHFLLQGIFPTQGSYPNLLHFRQTLYCLSHQGSKNNRLTQC